MDQDVLNARGDHSLYSAQSYVWGKTTPDLYWNLSKARSHMTSGLLQMKAEDRLMMLKALLWLLGLLCVTQENQLPGQVVFRTIALEAKL